MKSKTLSGGSLVGTVIKKIKWWYVQQFKLDKWIKKENERERRVSR